MTVAYDPGFYDLIRDGARRSAQVVAPVVLGAMDRRRPRTVLDVGCGEGWWALAFAGLGCEVTGVDGAYVADVGVPFVARDLAAPFDVGRFDLAVCLEVAEHLPESRAAGLIEDLCRAAPTILFSAAVPGQGGHGHINEQWPGYWVNLFHANEFAVSGALRWVLWGDDRIEPWYRQNLLVASTVPNLYPGLFNTPTAAVHPLVHPEIFRGRIT
jgi:SAM-dependent methyltransferase